MKILFFGDVFGRPGRNAVKNFIAKNKETLGIDLVIANADNMSSGRGPTQKTYDEMIDAGVDILTSGDHIWDNKEAIGILENKDTRLVRPMNYPKVCPGRGFVKTEVKGKEVIVANLLGRVWTTEGLDSPFVIADELAEDHKGAIIIIDFHAEATSEKVAFGNYLDGKVSAVLGTHTHVQTSDERILDEGLAYITDTGSCGPLDSVIGVEKELSIKRFTTGMPVTFEVASGPVQVNAVVVEIDEKSAKSKSIKRICEIFDN